jgi:hypothetical protein
MSARGANHHLRRTSGGGRISAAPEATQHARRPLAKLLEHPRPRQAVGLADEPLIGSNIGSEVPLAGLSLLLSELLPQLDEALQSEQPSRSHGTLIAPQTVPSGSFAAEPSDGAESR